MRNSSYFDITREPKSEAEIQKLLAQGTVQFAVEIPVDFSRKLLRGEQPDLLLEADATDPMAIGYAVGAMNSLTPTVLNRDLTGPLAKLRASSAPFNLVVHQHYNPENITQYNIVPGLMGVMLTMTMVIITALAITRERERGTMENLLSTPLRPGRSDHRQNRALHHGRLHPDFSDSGGGEIFVRRADGRQRAVAARAGVFVHRRESGGRHHVFDHRQKPASGGADGDFFFSCRTFCCPATCFRFAECRAGRRTSANACR